MGLCSDSWIPVKFRSDSLSAGFSTKRLILPEVTNRLTTATNTDVAENNCSDKLRRQKCEVHADLLKR